ESEASGLRAEARSIFEQVAGGNLSVGSGDSSVVSAGLSGVSGPLSVANRREEASKQVGGEGRGAQVEASCGALLPDADDLSESARDAELKPPGAVVGGHTAHPAGPELDNCGPNMKNEANLAEHSLATQQQANSELTAGLHRSGQTS